jgi:epoxyqueuosine reductase
MSLTQAVKAEARRLGFELVGVTTPDPPPHTDVFQRWLAAGRQGEMAYLESERSRQRRADPRQILPECRSILVLAARYPTPPANPSPDASVNPSTEAPGGQPPFPPASPNFGRGGGDEGGAVRAADAQMKPDLTGRVAAYAWGADYHDVLVERLRALVEFIQAQVGRPVPNRWYTDTGPLLERDLAQRAGLGWIGKNTCLINPQLGSYFLLAELLLGLELEPDQPFAADRCGSCTRCLEACPTACILPDRTLDARRCLSYLTIELKGPIPADLRSQIGDWVFGCDICQQVCPWNLRFAPSPQEPPAVEPLEARPGLPQPDLVAELALTPQAFNRKFKGSPLKRAKRRGYLRNVAVALGNRRDPRAVPALAQSLAGDPEALVRSHAAWALGQIGGEAARRALLEARQKEQDTSVLAEIGSALDQL